MILSKATEYSIRSLIYIRSKMDLQQHIGFREVAREIGAPEPFTGKILQELVRKGFLHSSKGPGGGFYLLDDDGPLALSTVIEAIEGIGFFERCGLGLKNCSADNPCPIHKKYARIRKQLRDLMATETIWSLAKKIKNGKTILYSLDRQT